MYDKQKLATRGSRGIRARVNRRDANFLPDCYPASVSRFSAGRTFSSLTIRARFHGDRNKRRKKKREAKRKKKRETISAARAPNDLRSDCARGKKNFRAQRQLVFVDAGVNVCQFIANARNGFRVNLRRSRIC